MLAASNFLHKRTNIMTHIVIIISKDSHPTSGFTFIVCMEPKWNFNYSQLSSNGKLKWNSDKIEKAENFWFHSFYNRIIFFWFFLCKFSSVVNTTLNLIRNNWRSNQSGRILCQNSPRQTFFSSLQRLQIGLNQSKVI